MSETKPVWDGEEVANQNPLKGYDAVGLARKALAAVDAAMPVVAAADALVAEVWQTTLRIDTSRNACDCRMGMPVLPTEVYLDLLRLRDALKQYHEVMADA